MAGIYVLVYMQKSIISYFNLRYIIPNSNLNFQFESSPLHSKTSS
jgi:hypothetical protein